MDRDATLVLRAVCESGLSGAVRRAAQRRQRSEIALLGIGCELETRPEEVACERLTCRSGKPAATHRDRQRAPADRLKRDADRRQRRGVEIVHLVDQEERAGTRRRSDLADLPAGFYDFLWTLHSSTESHIRTRFGLELRARESCIEAGASLSRDAYGARPPQARAEGPHASPRTAQGLRSKAAPAAPPGLRDHPSDRSIRA